MQPPKSDICVICGISPATTDEHVPPRGFFKGLSGQFLTVPACISCNNGSSKDDEELRFYISAQIGKQTQGAKLLWGKGAHKSVLRSTQLRSTFLSTLHEVPITLPNGEIANRLAVTSRAIIWSPVEQLRMSLIPVFHGLDGCSAVQSRLG